MVALQHQVTTQMFMPSCCSPSPPKPFLPFQSSSLPYSCSKKWERKRWQMQHTFLFNTSQILHPPSLLTSHWLNICTVATSNWKADKKSYFIFSSPAQSKKIRGYISGKEGENKNLNPTSIICRSFIWTSLLRIEYFDHLHKGEKFQSPIGYCPQRKVSHCWLYNPSIQHGCGASWFCAL